MPFNGGGLNFVFLVMLVAPVVTNGHAHLALAREQVKKIEDQAAATATGAPMQATSVAASSVVYCIKLSLQRLEAVCPP